MFLMLRETDHLSLMFREADPCVALPGPLFFSCPRDPESLLEVPLPSRGPKSLLKAVFCRVEPLLWPKLLPSFVGSKK